MTMMAKNHDHDSHNHDGHKQWPWLPKTMTMTAITVMATNHDSLKVYHDGHSNENVKNFWHTLKKSQNPLQIHGHTVFKKKNKISPSYVFGRHGLWPSLSNPAHTTTTVLPNPDTSEQAGTLSSFSALRLFVGWHTSQSTWSGKWAS